MNKAVQNLSSLATPLTTDKLKINTQEMVEEDAPLVIDFRAVNKELHFQFLPLDNPKHKDEPVFKDSVKLKVSVVHDYELPLYEKGPVTNERHITFSHVDENTVIYGGRYKNTLQFDDVSPSQLKKNITKLKKLGGALWQQFVPGKGGINFKGVFHGGSGAGRIGYLAGDLRDKAFDFMDAGQDLMFDMDVSAAAELYQTVENNLSFGSRVLTPTYVNLQKLKTERTETSCGEILMDLSSDFKAGNVLHGVRSTAKHVNNPALWLDCAGLEKRIPPRGLWGDTDSLTAANLDKVTVGVGKLPLPQINIVRGTDYSWKEVGDSRDAGSGDLTAFLESGADHISVGDSMSSRPIGAHFLFGGSGRDTYSFVVKTFGLGLVVDDLIDIDVSAEGAAGAALAAFVPRDTLDLSKTPGDWHFYPYSFGLADLAAFKDAWGGTGMGGIDGELPISVGMKAVLATSLKKSEWPDSSPFTEAFNSMNTIFAVGVENIIGGRGKNTFYFSGNNKIYGKISPGYGGSMHLVYADLDITGSSEGITVDLGKSGIDIELLPE
ncbi:MAG: hypothetical protein MK106_16220, partial [Mariniblastus sp.]|nr:hypothetical protein [Mariniblastus sp.]